MKFLNFSIACITLLIACGGGDFSNGSASSPNNDTDGGEGLDTDGDIIEHDAGDASGGSGGTASGGSDAGGTVNGGSNTGGSAGGSAGSGTAGSGPCIPKNCLTLAIELSGGDTSATACGVISDGCSNYIDCGGCGTEGCGVGGLVTTTTAPSVYDDDLSGTPGLCGGLCFSAEPWPSMICPGTAPPPQACTGTLEWNDTGRLYTLPTGWTYWRCVNSS